jgi:hypothetical protein
MISACKNTHFSEKQQRMVFRKTELPSICHELSKICESFMEIRVEKKLTDIA